MQSSAPTAPLLVHFRAGAPMPTLAQLILIRITITLLNIIKIHSTLTLCVRLKRWSSEQSPRSEEKGGGWRVGGRNTGAD